MGEFHVNQQVFQAFQQAVKSDGISNKELKKIQAAIMADGDYDHDEQQLVEQLESRSAETVQLIAGGDQLEFKASQVVKKELVKTLEGWDQPSKEWSNAFESKMAEDFSLSTADLEALRKAVKNPKDLELVTYLKNNGSYGEAVIEVKGFPYYLQKDEKNGDSWKLDQASVGGTLRQLAAKAVEEEPGGANRKKLVKLLNHPNMVVRIATADVLKKQIKNHWNLITDLKNAKIDKIKPEVFKEIEQSGLQEARQTFRVWQENVKAKLDEIKNDIQKPEAALEAWMLVEGAKFYEKSTGVKMDVVNREQLKSELMTTGKQALAQKDLPAESKLYWLRAMFTVDPKGTAKQLEKFLLTAPNPKHNQALENGLIEALKALLSSSPEARALEIARKIVDAQGKSPHWVKETAVEYLKKHEKQLDIKELEERLTNPQESLREDAMNKLASLATPESVQILLAHYQRHTSQTAEGSRAATLIGQLAEHENKATAAAAKQALEVIAGIEKMSSNLSGQTPAQKLSTLLDSLGSADLRKKAMEELIQLLETSPAADLQPLLEQMASEIPALDEDTARLARKVQEAYAGAGTSLEADLTRLAWLNQPDQQLSLLKAMMTVYPDQNEQILAALDQARDTGHETQPLNLEEQIDFARLRYMLDPEGSLPALKVLLAETEPGDFARRRALETVFMMALAPEQLQAWGRELLAGPDLGEAKLVVEAFRRKQWLTQENRDALLASPHRPAEQLGLEIIRDQILDDPKNSPLFSTLIDRHQQTPDAEGRRFIEGLIKELSASSDEYIAKRAQNYLDGVEIQNNRDAQGSGSSPKEVAERERKTQVLSKFIDLEAEPFYERGLKALTLLKQDGMLEDIAKYADGDLKGKIVQWLMTVKGEKSRDLVQKLVLSTKTQQEYNSLLTAARENSTSALHLGNYLGSTGAKAVEAHYEALKQANEAFIDSNETAMQNRDPVAKGDALGRVIAAYFDGKLDLAWARDSLTRIIKSFASTEDYQTGLETMLKNHRFSEDQLSKVLNKDTYEKLKKTVGKEVVTTYSDDEELARVAQDFFDLLARQIGQDGDLSYEWIENNVPEIRDHPGYAEFFGSQNGTNAHLRLCKLIAENKVQVAGVGANFVDRNLFGKLHPGIVELHGDLRVTNQLTGSVVDKAKQFIALDKAARMIHDKTYELLHGKSQALLGIASDVTYLQGVLDEMVTFIEDYAVELDTINSEPMKAAKALENISQKIRAKLIAQGVNASELKQKTKEMLEQVKEVNTTLKHYGSDAAKAAAKMKEEAGKLEALTRELEVDKPYEEDRGQFLHYQAFKIYHGELDVLSSTLKQELEKMGADGKLAKSVYDR
ncbi:MAG: hypothetical protein ACAI44_04755, partial [Candidatus Sericytochromatia bacterium]